MVMRVTELGDMLGETVSTVKRASFLLVLHIFSMPAVAAPAAAQNPTPTAAISVTCAPSNINVEVKPGYYRIYHMLLLTQLPTKKD